MVLPPGAQQVPEDTLFRARFEPFGGSLRVSPDRRRDLREAQNRAERSARYELPFAAEMRRRARALIPVIRPGRHRVSAVAPIDPRWVCCSAAQSASEPSNRLLLSAVASDGLWRV